MTDTVQTFTARVMPADLQFDAPGDLTLLEAAEMSRVQMPSSCRNGTCRTCICQLTQGQVNYTVDWPGLSAQEKAEGLVLPCVAQPLSDVVLLHPAAKAG